MARPPLPRAAPRRSRGSMALEAMIAVGIASVLTAAAATLAVQTVRAHAAQRVASVIAQVDHAMRSYVLHRRKDIDDCAVLRQSSPGAACPALLGAVADVMAPTPAELASANLLPEGFSSTVPGLLEGDAPGDDGLVVQVTVVPALVGQDPSATNIQWIVHSKKPLTSSLAAGGPDAVLAAQVSALLRAPAAYSTLAQPGVLLAPSGQTMPNPLGNQAAVVAAIGGYQSSDLAAMLPRAGGTMTGPIVGAPLVQAAGLRASLTQATAQAGNACTTLGLIVEEAGSGRLLTCQSRGGSLVLLPPVATGGQWVSEGSYLGGKVVTNSSTDQTWLVSARGGSSTDLACQGKYSLRAFEQGSNLELARMEDLSATAGGASRSASLQLPVPPQGALVLVSSLQCGGQTVDGAISVSTFRPQ
jgi:hypothetical protein